jgi:SAM-dependent methyltransferase
MQFHKRRLFPDRDGHVPQSALTDRVEFTQDYATDIVSCTACGLIFRNPRPTPQAISHTYAQDEYGHDHLAAAFDAQLEPARVKAKSLSPWLLRRREVHIVEVGSFVGSFLSAGQERGWNMLGVDPGHEVTAFCRERGLRVHQGTLADAPLKPQSVDCVAVWNTFDQLPDPHPTLKAAQRVLRPGGLLVLRVPNGACFQWAEVMMRRWPRPLRRWLRAAMAWNNLLAFPYLQGYSLPTLDRLTRRYGMQRVAAYPDTLVRLADAQTKAWAAQEERLVKLICRAVCWMEGRRAGSLMSSAPWLDVYYRYTPHL